MTSHSDLAVMYALAPKTTERVLISDPVTPHITLPIVSVVGHDSKADAWHITTELVCDRGKCEAKCYGYAIPEGPYSLWTKYDGEQWRVFDANAPRPRHP